MDYDRHVLNQTYDLCRRSSDLAERWHSAIRVFAEWAAQPEAKYMAIKISDIDEEGTVDVDFMTVKLRLRFSLCMPENFSPRARVDVYEVMRSSEREERHLGFLTFNTGRHVNIGPQYENEYLDLDSLPEIVLTAARSVLLDRAKVPAQTDSDQNRTSS